ncbi:hypothetical protein L596_014245 [Steinernema carpocapsae]|uniref:Pre-mRNA-splicing factor 38 n=1 Tax=Steinernema carpocapsae TaxID=34508 RepID=A0A4U5NBA4_STECR|nr:hypothetical protein L596_014245 [Steinernema carpocapsae]
MYFPACRRVSNVLIRPSLAAMNPADAATAAAVQAMVNAGVMVNQEVIYEDDEADASIPDIQKITKKNNVLPLWGNAETMNLNALVLSNVVQSTYFKNYLSEATGFQQMTEELYYNVTHLEPWERGTRKTQGMTGMCGGVRGVGAGGVVSTAYCILYKLFTMRLTRKQLVGLINNTTSPFSRGIGFMYIRYTSPPSDLWAWMEPYLDDEEEIDPRSGGGDKMTVGQMVKTMITKLDWYGTLFPRIPVLFRRKSSKSSEIALRRKMKVANKSAKNVPEKRSRKRCSKAMDPRSPEMTGSDREAEIAADAIGTTNPLDTAISALDMIGTPTLAEIGITIPVRIVTTTQEEIVIAGIATTTFGRIVTTIHARTGITTPAKTEKRILAKIGITVLARIGTTIPVRSATDLAATGRTDVTGSAILITITTLTMIGIGSPILTGTAIPAGRLSAILANCTAADTT